MSNENLMIEVVGSSEKAVNALDKVIKKISELQNKFLSAIPSIDKFNNSLKSISGNSPLKNIVEQTAKTSAEIQKMQSQTVIASAKAQSAMAKAAFDAENYAFKSEKLAKAKEKLAAAERKAAENAKWEAEAMRSLEDAVNRTMLKMQAGSAISQNQFPKTEKLQPTTFANRDVAAEIDAITRASAPTIDMSRIKEQSGEIEAFIARLTPAISNMSETAQSKFAQMGDKLRDVNENLEKQKQIYEQLSASYNTLSPVFGKSGAANLGLDKKLESTKSSIKKLTAESNRLKTSMQRLASPTRNVSSALDKTRQSADRARKSFGSLGQAGKGLGTFGMAMGNVVGNLIMAAFQKLIKVISEGIKQCMDFTKNMNLFNVSLGENAKRAGEFVDKMSAAFGLDSSNLVRTMGNFYQIANSMGVTSENAYVLSENFTKLAADLSSFYNISMSAAVTKLQAGLVGETEPLRRLGIIITENALKQTAANLGIEKSIRDMSEAEKMHLRYITAMEQTKKVQGDFARNMTSPAQGMKILKEQISQLTRAIGSVFIPMLSAVLPYIIAFTKALTTLIRRFAEFVGYKPPSYQDLGSGFSVSAKNADKFGKSVGGTVKQVKELKKQVMGFDELNILSKQEKKAKKGSGGDGNFAAPDLTGYDNMMDNDELQQKFKKFGEAFEPARQALSRFKEALKPFAKKVGVGLRWFLKKVLVPIGKWVMNKAVPAFLELLAGALKILNPILEIAAPLLDWLWNKFLKPIASWTGGVICTVLKGIGKALGKIGDWMKDNKETVTTMIGVINAFFAAWEVTKLLGFIQMSGGVTAVLLKMWSAFKKLTIAKIIDKAETVAITALYAKDLIVSLTKGTIEIGKQIIKWGILTGAKIFDAIKTGVLTVATVVMTGVQTALNFVMSLNPIMLIVIAIGLLIAGLVLLWNKCEGFRNFVTELIDVIKESILELWNNISEWASNCWNAIVEIWEGVTAWFNSTIIEPVKNFFSNLWSKITEFASKAWDGIKSVWDKVCEWFKSTIIEPIKNFFSGLWSKITEFASKAWDEICKVWSKVSNWFKEKVITPIKDFFSRLWDSIKNIFKTVSSWFGGIFAKAKEAVKNAFSGVVDFFSGIWNRIKEIFTTIGSVIGDAISGAFKTVVNSVINFAEGMINKFIRSINGAIDLINHIPGVSINRLQEINIPRLAKGGLVTESVIANIGEGQHDEAVLPLSDAVFERIADGINKNAQSSSALDEETLYRAFLRALSDSPERNTTFVATLNSKVIAKEVIKEQNNRAMRFNPVYT